MSCDSQAGTEMHETPSNSHEVPPGMAGARGYDVGKHLIPEVHLGSGHLTVRIFKVEAYSN